MDTSPDDPYEKAMADNCRACKADYEAKLAEARKFAEDAAAKYNDLLKQANTVTCAFCGETYPQGTPRHGDGALTEHIAVCPEHPMRKLEQDMAELVKLCGETDETASKLRRKLRTYEDGVSAARSRLQTLVSAMGSQIPIAARAALTCLEGLG